MSDFRRFCIGFWFSATLLIACINHGWFAISPEKGSPQGIALWGLLWGSAIVTLFGRKSA